jgi:hypothetical protein
VSHSADVLYSVARPQSASAARRHVGRRAARRLAPALLIIALACAAGDNPPTARTGATASRAAAPPAGVGRAPADRATPVAPNSPPDSSAAPGAPPPSASTTAPRGDQALHDEVLRELATFRLTTERVDKWGVAQRKLNELTSQNPEVIRNMTSLGPPKSLDEMVVRFDSQPSVHKAIAAAGLSPREYVLTMLTLQRSMQGYFGRRAGRLRTPPAGVSGENIDFVEQHIAEIQQLMAELRRPQPSGVRPQ